MFHQPVHSADTDVNAIITQKDVGGFVSSEALPVIRMDMENQGSNMLVLPDTGRGLWREMLVISASVDPKNPAEGADAVLEAELMNRV